LRAGDPRASSRADERALRQAEDQTSAARARLAGLDGPGSRLALSERAAGELERRIASLTFKAPAAGVVYGLPRRVGEAVAAGQVVASVVDPERRRLRAPSRPADLPRVSRQRLILSFDGLPRKRWDNRGHVRLAGPRRSADAGRRSPGRGRGSQGQLPTTPPWKSRSSRRRAHLVVPRASASCATASAATCLLEGPRAPPGDQVGLSGLNGVEIVGGVSEKDVVILPGSTSLSEGLRVRAEPR
jgi:hypothetical protein